MSAQILRVSPRGAILARNLAEQPLPGRSLTRRLGLVWARQPIWKRTAFVAFVLSLGIAFLLLIRFTGWSQPVPAIPDFAPAAQAADLTNDNLARADAFLALPTPLPLATAQTSGWYDAPITYPYWSSAAPPATPTTVPTAVPSASPGTTAVSIYPRATGWQADFIQSVGLAARSAPYADRIPASVTIAQAILESDWGRSSLAKDAKNYFGIKAAGKSGSAGYVTLPTLEYAGNHPYWVEAPFRAYKSVADSVADHHLFLVENSRYRNALAVGSNAEAFANALQRAGYATDPRYAAKLLSYMDTYDLYRYDYRG